MAILYLSNRNPDFSTDYQVSPIMTPSEILARFPRVLDALRGEGPVCGRHHHLCRAVTRVQKGPFTELGAKDGKRGVFGDGSRRVGAAERGEGGGLGGDGAVSGVESRIPADGTADEGGNGGHR
jgi:hypothetical protein